MTHGPKPVLVLAAAVLFGVAGESQGDMIIRVIENTDAGTVDISYSGTLDVAGLGTPQTLTYVSYAFSAGGSTGLVYLNNHTDSPADSYQMANLEPISGTTMGPGNGTFNIMGPSGSGDLFVWDDGSSPTRIAVEQGFSSGSISGSTSVPGTFADFGITPGFEDVVYLLPNIGGDTVTFTSVPGPGTLALLGGWLIARRRRRR